MDEQIGIFEDALHPFRIRHEIRRQIAAVELHAFNDIESRFKALGFFNSDHALFTDFVHRLGDNIADGGVSIGGDGADLGDLLGVLGGLA